MNPSANVIRILLVAQVLTGCATSSPDFGSDSGATSTCHVCRYNNDLACVCVRVKDRTPKAEYGGETYYFCSDDCRAAFLKRPEKYLPKRPEK